MLLKKLKRIFLCAAMVLSGILLSGCDSSSAELVDEITAEATASVTAENTKAAAETVSETTTVTTTEATTEITTTETTTEITTPETTTEVTAKTTAEADTEVPTETATAVLPEITTTTRTETTIETTTEAPSETTTETTTETTQPLNLTPEELEVYNSMPDIVFVLSHCYGLSDPNWGSYSNIRGFYITKNGEVKMYAFSNEEESKYIDVAEVYDELENVTCSELLFRGEGDEITQDDLDTVAISDLIELYNKLLLVDEKSKFKQSNNYCDVVTGIYQLYGIRTNKNGGKEIILLSLRGDYYLTNKDIYAQEISDEVWNIGYPFSEYRMLS